VLLTIAGHDPGSGAGVTADLATFAAQGCFGVSAVTALTVQSTRGVASVHPVEAELLRRTLEHLAEDMPAAGTKIGMLGSAAVAEVVAEFLGSAGRRGESPRVLDPVLRASSGAELLAADAGVLHRTLLPVVDWVTPNWSELAALLGVEQIGSLEEAEAAAHLLGTRYPQLYVVVTGGDEATPTDLLRLPAGEIHRFAGTHIETNATHGTGCAFSSALLARLVLGDDAVMAVGAAKAYVAEAMRRAPGLGHGKGPLGLLWPLRQGRQGSLRADSKADRAATLTPHRFGV
jgi:hydroxymethylpyrimidine/phosphomethylpyrimidine kinase